MSVPDHDIVIAGAGCAGLSVAVHLIEHGIGGRRVALVDPRTEFGRDRTWCSFRVMHHPFERAVTHRWAQWQVRNEGHTVTRGSARHAYEHVASDAFYRIALERIAACERVSLELGTRVEDVVDRGDHAVVRTNRGELRALLVLDSRPPRLDTTPRPATDVRLLQGFVGWRVRSEDPVFDPGTCTLMDFAAPRDDGVRFVYVLPFSEHDALVEDTVFAEQPLEDAEHERGIAQWLETRGIEDYEVLERERGVLPMTTERFDAEPTPRVIRIGVAGGLARPSTGYAFLAIQRHARALAERLARDEVPARPAPRGARTLLLDRIFLSYLARHPAGGPALFTQLFERTDPDVLARFMSEASSPTDDVRVMRSLPALPFAREALRSRHLWLRR